MSYNNGYHPESPEAVALYLFGECCKYGTPKDKEELLRLYAECLKAVKNPFSAE